MCARVEAGVLSAGDWQQGEQEFVLEVEQSTGLKIA